MLDFEELREKLEKEGGRENVSTDELLEFVALATGYENALVEIMQEGTDSDADLLVEIASEALGLGDDLEDGECDGCCENCDLE